MPLQERVYSVLIVSASERFNTALVPLFPAARYHPIRCVSSVSAAGRLFAERAFDLVIINAPLPDDSGVRFAIDICGSSEAAVLLLARAELHAEVYEKVSPHGVLTLPRPSSRSALLSAIDWMASIRERLRKKQEKTLSMEEKMEEIRLVNRAKWLLIGELRMAEPEAHRYIEKQAMDRCVSKRLVAEEIIRTYS
jgi:response regulator NasT